MFTILVNMLTITINMINITAVKIGRSKLCARDLADKVDACQGETQIILAMLAMMTMVTMAALEGGSFCDIFFIKTLHMLTHIGDSGGPLMTRRVASDGIGWTLSFFQISSSFHLLLL